jgi:hypothetical protein
MKAIFLLAAVLAFPIAANADIGRAEAARKEDACEHAKANAQATCANGQAKEIGQCDCVERQTTLYLKNWRCAVEAKCEDKGAEQPPPSDDDSSESH